MSASTKTKSGRGKGEAATKRTAGKPKQTSKKATQAGKSTAKAPPASNGGEPSAVAKPSYLGLLNAIAVAEHGAHEYLSAWADTTKNDELAEVLRFVGVREGEHFHAFRKRIVELGYDVRFPADTEIRAKNLEIARSSMTDDEKWRYFDLGQVRDHDVFDDMFHDKTIDPITGGLLGRYIAEERDSARRFAACYAAGTTTAKASA